MGVRITILADRLEVLKELAHRRNDVKAEYGVVDRRYDTKQDSFTIDYKGIQAEEAVAIWLQDQYPSAYIDESISPAGDDGVNDILGLPGDFSVQVKSTHHVRGHLYFNSLDLFKADIAVLAIYLVEGEFDIIGWADYDHFKKTHHVRNFGYGDRCCLNQWELTPA